MEELVNYFSQIIMKINDYLYSYKDSIIKDAFKYRCKIIINASSLLKYMKDYKILKYFWLVLLQNYFHRCLSVKTIRCIYIYNEQFSQFKIIISI